MKVYLNKGKKPFFILEKYTKFDKNVQMCYNVFVQKEKEIEKMKLSKELKKLESELIVYHTCKEIDPITKTEYQKYDEVYLIYEVNEKSTKLLNMVTGKINKFDNYFIAYSFKIKKMELLKEM